MSTSTANPASREEIPSSDAHFVFECVRNMDGNGAVDLVQVSKAMGYTNVASAGNRFRMLRKRYNLKLECKNTVNTKNASSKSKSNTDTSAPTDAAANGTTTATVSPKKPRGRKLLPKPIPVNGAAGGSEAIAAHKQNANSKGSKVKEPISPALLQAVDLAIHEDGIKEEVKVKTEVDTDVNVDQDAA